MVVKVRNQEGAEIGSVELKPELFGIEPNEAVVHQYIVALQANQRQGTHDTKTRKEVSGGGKKPWRQKGTGRARSGTSRSPLWRGGGTIFGPHPRSYTTRLPAQMRRLAIQSVFSDKAKRENIMVLDRINVEKPRTKSIVTMLEKLALADKKCLILDEGRNQNVTLSCRNIPNVKYCRASLANGYDLLHADVVVFTRAGLDKAQEVFA